MHFNFSLPAGLSAAGMAGRDCWCEELWLCFTKNKTV